MTFKRLWLCSASVAALALVAAATAGAGTAPQSWQTNLQLGLIFSSEHQAVAQPLLSLRTGRGPLRISNGVPTGAGRTRDESNQQAFKITSGNWWRTPVVGKIYFNLPGDADGQVHYCSGTVVSTNIVLTAGHCIWDPESQNFGTAWKFVPDKWGGDEPYGAWFATMAWVPDEWQNSRGAFSPDDYGFLVLKPNAAGQNVAAAVGSATIVYGTTPGSFLALGYPAAGWFSTYLYNNERGTYPYYTYSPYGDYSTYTFGDETGYTLGMGNYETGGSSGGPWFGAYNGQWNNYVFSLNSHCWAPAGSTSNCSQSMDAASYSRNMWGPYFTSRINDDLAYARSLTP